MIRAVAIAVCILAALAGTVFAAADTPEIAVAYARINRVRVANGLAPVSPDARLEAAARRLAEDMARNDFFGHVGSDGSNTGQRADEAGYRWRRIAENVAAGPAAGDEIVDMWMRSPGHRRNLLTADVVHAGIAHVHQPADSGAIAYRHYWVLVLAAPQAVR